MMPMNNTNVLYVQNQEGREMGVVAPISFSRGPLNPGLGKSLPYYRIADRLDVDVVYVERRNDESFPSWAARAALEALAEMSPEWVSDINAATALSIDEMELIDWDALEYANQGDRSQPVGWPELMSDLE